MFYIVYKITNQINGKFYIGSHKTKDLNDNYMGSGKYLKYSQEKYGVENFTKEILFVFDNAEEMYAKEAEIVTEDFLAEENTYNLKVGGFGGFDHLNDGSEKHIQRCRRAASIRVEKLRESGYYKSTEFVDRANQALLAARQTRKDQRLPPPSFKGQAHTPETKAKLSKIMSEKYSGGNNPQSGKMWIHNPAERLCKMIHASDTIPEGWVKGRKINRAAVVVDNQYESSR